MSIGTTPRVLFHRTRSYVIACGVYIAFAINLWLKYINPTDSVEKNKTLYLMVGASLVMILVFLDVLNKTTNRLERVIAILTMVTFGLFCAEFIHDAGMLWLPNPLIKLAAVTVVTAAAVANLVRTA